jgi:hypothetical protein
MTNHIYREAILTTINTRNGVNGVDLVLKCMGIINPLTFSNKDYIFILAELVASGEIVELEFILPSMDYRMKSIYFPKGTKLYVNSHDQAKTKDTNNAQSASL